MNAKDKDLCRATAEQAGKVGVDESLHAGRLLALQRGLELARKWAGDGAAGDTGTYFADSLIRRMGEQMRAALSSQDGDYDAKPTQPAATQMPVVWIHPMTLEEVIDSAGDERGHAARLFGQNSPGCGRSPLFAAPVSPSREVE